MSLSTPGVFSSFQIFKDGWFQFFVFLAFAGGIGLMGSTSPSPRRPVSSPVEQSEAPITREQPLPERVAPRVAAKNPGKWLVDPTGASDSDAKTLTAVIAQALPGETIYVRPGIYNENLLLKQDLHLIAADPTGNPVIIESNTEPVIRSEHASVSMDGIQVRFFGQNSSAAAIQIVGGKWNASRTQIQSTRGDLISAQMASIEIEDAKFLKQHDTQLDGIVLESSQFSCKLCQFNEVAIHQNSNPIGQSPHSTLTITASSFEGESSKIMIGGQSESKISSTEFKGTKTTAILCAENSDCDLQDLKFIENLGIAVMGTGWSKIHIQGGYALKTFGPTIGLAGKSEFHASNFRIEETSGDGISAIEDSSVDLLNVKFDSGKSNGITASGRVRVSAKNCEFSKNAKMGIFLTEDARVLEDQQNQFVENLWGTITKKVTL